MPRDIDGYLFRTDDKLIELIKTAYRRTAKIPSRGATAGDKWYASAADVFFEAYGEMPDSGDWLIGFCMGFEIHDKQVINETLGWDRQEYVAGFKSGLKIALAIFDRTSWDAPNIYSKPQT